YQQYVLGVREPMQWSGAMDPRQSGTLLHTVFEQLYAPYVGQRLVDAHFEEMLVQFDKILLQHYANMHGGKTRRTGKNLLIYEALKYYGNNWLVEEQKRVAQGAQIKILSLEQKVEHTLRLPNLGHTIVLQGHIDRIDEYNGQLRIIDYKSGKITPSMLNITSWDKVLNQEKPGPAFQLMTYAYLYYFSVESQPLFAGIMAFQDPMSYTIPLLHPGSVKSSEESQLLSKNDLLEFEQQLILLIEELMNPKLPFSKAD
ncbi:MAG: PD-(D/E)XK nuclease family protein, partial [Flavobacteriaceae bacterium]